MSDYIMIQTYLRDNTAAYNLPNLLLEHVFNVRRKSPWIKVYSLSHSFQARRKNDTLFLLQYNIINNRSTKTVCKPIEFLDTTITRRAHVYKVGT